MPCRSLSRIQFTTNSDNRQIATHKKLSQNPRVLGAPLCLADVPGIRASSEKIALNIRALRKSGAFNEGQLTACSFQHPGFSHDVLIIVDLRLEHNLKVGVKHGDSNTDIQVIRLTHRPAGFNGRRWYFVSEKGERAEKLFWVDGRFRTRKEARLTYRSQSMGELDRVLERRRKLEAQLKGTRARGPASVRRRKQTEERLEEIEHLLTGFELSLVHRDQHRRAHALER